ncbi:glycosyltransferase family 4 protein [Candidatus Pacearchaeota archaeon]|nr:glycosyltransferase family 4 protein [Candidatus Pacearchaeota archaeon]
MLYPWLLELDLSPAKTIFWFPSDGGGALPTGCEHILKKMNCPIAMAKFGQEQCKKVHNLDVHHIPHAVDVKNYFPLKKNERDELRKKWNLNDKFVIGVVARNQGRKMLDRTIKMMALYAKINPNAILLMHCDANDPAQVFPISQLINRYGIQNRVLFTGTTYFKGFDYKKMNDVYNLMDVFLLTTSGEGFGVPIIEAMACEVPVIATDYTTTGELVLDNNSGVGIDLVGTEIEENPRIHGDEILNGTLTGSWAVERGICDIKDGAKKLDYLFKNLDKRKEFGLNGRKAVLEKYDWNVTKKAWFDVINKLGGDY